jgi:hypothetical protein
MSNTSTESWTPLDAGSGHGSKPSDKIHGSRQIHNGPSVRSYRSVEKPRSFGDGTPDGFRSPRHVVVLGGASPASRRHLAPVEVRAQAASELLASEDFVGTPSSGSGGSSSSPPPSRTLPQRRHTMPANMLPPLVVPAFRPPLLWTDSSRSRGDSTEASPGLASPGHNKVRRL